MSEPSSSFRITHLDQLESEAIHVMREVAAQFERSVLLYSIGKDSSVLLHLARKAFAPGPIEYPLLHVDTGYKFDEMIEFRDKIAASDDLELLVHRNETAIADGASPERLGTERCCGLLKTEALLQALRAGRYQAAIGGARRDEERSRSKERFFSFRDEFGQWDPKNQRPELWSLFNGRIREGESIRAFPLSNWTELDVWLYIEREDIAISDLYFARERPVFKRQGLLIPTGPRDLPAQASPQGDASTEDTSAETELCRFRTLGCYPCTGAVASSATTVSEIIAELLEQTTSERSTRVIDHDSDASMEKKKREGYF